MSIAESRQRAHRALDRLWKPSRRGKAFMTRGAAYLWFQMILDLGPDDAHISKLDEAMCRQLTVRVGPLIALIVERRKRNPGRVPQPVQLRGVPALVREQKAILNALEACRPLEEEMPVYSDNVTALVQEYVKIQEDLRLRTMHRKKTLRHEKSYERQIEILKKISELCPNESPLDVVRALSDVYDT